MSLPASLRKWRDFAHTEPGVMSLSPPSPLDEAGDPPGSGARPETLRRKFCLTMFVRPLVVVAVGATTTERLRID